VVLGGALVLDIATLSARVTAAQPSGEDLRYAQDFKSLLKMAKEPEQRMENIDGGKPAPPLNWGKIEERAASLLARSKDLRIAAVLVKARLHNDGLAGLSNGLAAARALLERHWDTIHPQPDVEDENKFTERVNAVSGLGDEGLLKILRATEVAQASGARVCVRDLERSRSGGNSVRASGQPDSPETTVLDGVLTACDQQALARTEAASAAALDDVRAIKEFVADKVGDAYPGLSQLVELLEVVKRALGSRVRKDGVEGERRGSKQDQGSTALGVVTVGNGTAHDADPSPETMAVVPRGADHSIGAITSREDVVLVLDRICAYYEQFEPSSPIPLLLKRSKQLVAMSFMDIVRDLLPDAVKHVEALRGKQT
jgi:type VI secretion system protein ImpA